MVTNAIEPRNKDDIKTTQKRGRPRKNTVSDANSESQAVIKE